MKEENVFFVRFFFYRPISSTSWMCLISVFHGLFNWFDFLCMRNGWNYTFITVLFGRQNQMPCCGGFHYIIWVSVNLCMHAALSSPILLGKLVTYFYPISDPISCQMLDVVILNIETHYCMCLLLCQLLYSYTSQRFLHFLTEVFFPSWALWRKPGSLIARCLMRNPTFIWISCCSKTLIYVNDCAIGCREMQHEWTKEK